MTNNTATSFGLHEAQQMHMQQRLGYKKTHQKAALHKKTIARRM
jgi:hypothetical protein